MSTSQVNPAPFDGPGNDPENDPDLATPPVRTPDRDNPLIEQAEPSPDEAEEEDPNDQLPPRLSGPGDPGSDRLNPSN